MRAPALRLPAVGRDSSPWARSRLCSAAASRILSGKCGSRANFACSLCLSVVVRDAFPLTAARRCARRSCCVARFGDLLIRLPVFSRLPQYTTRNHAESARWRYKVCRSLQPNFPPAGSRNDDRAQPVIALVLQDASDCRTLRAAARRLAIVERDHVGDCLAR